MPTYEYCCQKCKRDFVITLSIKDQGAHACVIVCPECKGDKVEKKYGGFTAVTSKKS